MYLAAGEVNALTLRPEPAHARENRRSRRSDRARQRALCQAWIAAAAAILVQRGGPGGSQANELLREIGGVLLIQHKMVGHVEVLEKPDVHWDYPELERFDARLRNEYELRERERALNRKLELVSRTVATLLELIQNRRSLRVEWYIVLLILFEIALTLYACFSRDRRPHPHLSLVAA